MGRLASYRHLPIDWDMTPEEAVTLYLEWGNNCHKHGRCPVRSKDDVSYYFVVNTWDEKPLVSLLKRNSEEVQELASLPLPDSIQNNFFSQYGTPKGVFGINQEMKHWLEREMS
jgi:hypothetical protein